MDYAPEVDAKERTKAGKDLPARYTLADKRLDCQQAFTDAQLFHAEVREIHKHFSPWRTQTTDRNNSVQGNVQAASLMNGIYDGTGISAAAAFVANMQADWMPSFEPIFEIEAGPLMQVRDDQVADFRRKLEGINKGLDGLSAPVRLAALDGFYDLFAGTMAMCITPGDKRRKVIAAQAAPILEIAMSTGPLGTDIERWFWKRNYLARHLPEVWPDAKFSDKLARMMRESSSRNSSVEVIQYTYWDHRENAYLHQAWTSVCETTLLQDETLRVTPWVTPRMFVVPGEAMGRGLGHLALPSARTINKAREYALRAAAIQLLGMWMHRRDGVFNPDVAELAPGVFWEVAQAAGPMATIQRLDAPYNFDLPQFVINDERNELRRVSLDDELPELADRVRSPTEIAARQRRYDRNRGGNTVRLSHEMIAPIARACLDVVDRQGLLPPEAQGLRIDDVLIKAAIKSPAALAQQARMVERYTSFMQIIIGLFGPQAVLLAAEVEQIIPKIARWMGVAESDLRTKGGTEELKAMIAEYAAQLVAAEQAKGQQAKAQTMPEPDPVEQYAMQGGF